MEMYTFKDKWCEQAFTIMHDAHPEWPEVKLRNKIEDIFNKKFVDPKCTMTNNYLAISKRTTIMSIFVLIINKVVILGGDGCMFMQHKKRLSRLAKWISELKRKRKAEKKARDKYDKGTPDWRKHDLNQGNIKVLINSLYGILGYMKFHLFNVNLAQSVTATGQNIISTASCAFENFMSDNIRFISLTEILIYIENIKTEFNETYDSKANMYSQIPSVTIENVAERLIGKAGFNMTEDEIFIMIKVLASCSDDCLKLVFYKNNVDAFIKLSMVEDISTGMLNEIQVLRLGEISAFDTMGEPWNATVASKDAKDLVLHWLDLLQTFVLYKYQIFDRVRRTKYTSKKSVLYIDTDSNFLSLNKFVTHDKTLPTLDKSSEEYRFKSVSLYTILLSSVVGKTYEVFTASLNIDPEYGKIVGMKNEFFFDSLFFGLAKKRYIGRMLIQEGKLITDPNEQREVKGFDFIKANVKSNIKDKITEIIDTRMLFADNVDIRAFIKDVRSFEKEIKDRILSGDHSFFRQVTVQEAARYAAPLSNSGFKSAFIWNAFMPTNIHEFPSEVDIIPLTLDIGMTPNKYLLLRDDPEAFFNSKEGKTAVNMRNFYYNHREIFDNYRRSILMNPKLTYKEAIQGTNKFTAKTLAISSIAKPRSMTEIPDWMRDIIDIAKITNNIISLINPILEPLGPQTLQTSSTTAHYSNIVDI